MNIKINYNKTTNIKSNALSDKKLIFESLYEALDYSKRHYKGHNIIKNESEKIIGGSSAKESWNNPVLYVITSNNAILNKKSSTLKLSDDKQKLTKVKFTKTLSGFDQL